MWCKFAVTVGVSESGNIGTIVLTKSSTGIMNRRRHSVASHPIPSINNNISQFNHVNATSSSSATSTTSTATISHQRTLSLPLAASAINQTQSSKRSMLRCMYFSITLSFSYFFFCIAYIVCHNFCDVVFKMKDKSIIQS